MKTNWPTKKLGEIIELHYGKGISKYDRKTNGKYPVYGANGELGRTDKYLVEGEAIIVGRKGSAGEVTRVSGKLWPADVTYYVFGNKIIDIDFLFYFFKLFDLRRFAVGVKPGINRNRVYEIEIPLPPLELQKKIVKKIEELFAKITQAKLIRDSAVRDTNSLIPVYLRQVFDSAQTRSWPMTLVGDVCEIKGGKRLPGGHKITRTKTKHPYLRVTDFIPYGVDKSDIRYINENTFEQISRYTISNFDVFISIAGTIGVTGVIPESLDGANLTENAAKLTSLKNINQLYLMYMLTSEQVKDQIRGEAIQTTISKLGLFRIARLKIPLPPIAEQKKIVERMDALTQKVRELQALQSQTASDLIALKQSILHQAFQGKMVN